MPARDVAPSLDALLAGATAREPFSKVDGKSGATLERVVIDGQRYVVKTFDLTNDWLLRASGDVGYRAVALWEHGVYDLVPETIDHTVVAAARDDEARTAALLQRDVTPWLMDVEAPMSMADHRAFLAAMAELHAAHWGFTEDLGLIPMTTRYLILTPSTGELEEHCGGVPAMLRKGWAAALAEVPDHEPLLSSLLADPWPLVDALAGTPCTLVHGDCKLGNMGRHPDGRTIMFDWDRAGSAPATFDLGWYLAVNTDLLPEPKEAAIDAYRAALEGFGVDTGAWWDEQLALTLLGSFLQLGWSKSGQPEELAWWSARMAEARAWL